MKHLLSKSSFIRAMQCMKDLYFYKHHYQLRDPLSPERFALFNRGTDVGVLARELFPGGVIATPRHYSNLSEQVRKTREWMESGTAIIYEAAFQFEQVLVLLDILVKQNGKWAGFEVKSASKISSTYLLDASLQHYVISNSGVKLEDFSIIHLNNQYVRKGELKLEKLFRIVSVLKDANKNEKMIRKKIAEAKKTLSQKSIPEIKIGEHCFSPYRCDFIGHCWKHVPKYSVFDLGSMNKRDQFELFNSGIKKIKDIPPLQPLNDSVRIQVESFSKNKIIVNKKKLKEFLASLRYPICFLDVEAFMPAVPLFNNTKPYEHIPFQYSIHIEGNRNDKPKHIEFLAEAGIDPRQSFLEHLLHDTNGEGDIVAYSAALERNVLSNLRNYFPEFSNEIDKRISRIKDLALPFERNYFYHPQMMGSNSIKDIFPALVPALQYDDTDSQRMKITGGASAMNAFQHLQTEADLFKIAETREALLEYCKMDTFAMVKILEVLWKAAE